MRWHTLIALTRLKRPTGIWLLLWPCWWSLALASTDGPPPVSLLILFAVGALLMRSAGCIINDMADREFDAQVERTKSRPLASGEISIQTASLLLGMLLSLSLGVVLLMRSELLYYAAASLLLVAAYPFMKRITFWPQAFLGLTFNLGALFGWIALHGAPDWPALWLYLAGICWTIGYDTIYAHQDIEDDIKVGVKSTAIRFGQHNPQWILGFYIASCLCFGLALGTGGSGFFGYAALAVMATHLRWQCHTFKPSQPKLALKLFKSNAALGGVLAALLWVDSSFLMRLF